MACASAMFYVGAAYPYHLPKPPTHSPDPSNNTQPPYPYFYLHPPSKNSLQPRYLDEGVQSGFFRGLRICTSWVCSHVFLSSWWSGGSGAGVTSSFSAASTFHAPSPASNVQRYCDNSTNLACRRGGSPPDYAHVASAIPGNTMTREGRYST